MRVITQTLSICAHDMFVLGIGWSLSFQSFLWTQSLSFYLEHRRFLGYSAKHEAKKVQLPGSRIIWIFHIINIKSFCEGCHTQKNVSLIYSHLFHNVNLRVKLLWTQWQHEVVTVWSCSWGPDLIPLPFFYTSFGQQVYITLFIHIESTIINMPQGLNVVIKKL